MAIFLNVFLPGGFKYMLFLIRTLQMILHLPMLSIPIPGNMSMFCNTVFPIVMFDVLEQIESVDASLIFEFDFEGQEKL